MIPAELWDINATTWIVRVTYIEADIKTEELDEATAGDNILMCDERIVYPANQDTSKKTWQNT